MAKRSPQNSELIPYLSTGTAPHYGSLLYILHYCDLQSLYVQLLNCVSQIPVLPMLIFSSAEPTVVGSVGENMNTGKAGI